MGAFTFTLTQFNCIEAEAITSQITGLKPHLLKSGKEICELWDWSHLQNNSSGLLNLLSISPKRWTVELAWAHLCSATDAPFCAGLDLSGDLLHCWRPALSVGRKGRLHNKPNEYVFRWCSAGYPVQWTLTWADGGSNAALLAESGPLLLGLQVFDCLQHRDLSVTVLSDCSVAEYKTADYLHGSSAPFLRSLRSSAFDGRPACPSLEQPNIVTGLPAAGNVRARENFPHAHTTTSLVPRPVCFLSQSWTTARYTAFLQLFTSVTATSWALTPSPWRRTSLCYPDWASPYRWEQLLI